MDRERQRAYWANRDEAIGKISALPSNLRILGEEALHSLLDQLGFPRCSWDEYQMLRRRMEGVLAGQFKKTTKGRVYTAAPSPVLHIVLLALYGRVDAFTGGPLPLEDISADA